MGYDSLHPELLRIRQEYEELYEAVTSGHVSEDEAGSMLHNITAVDGDGALWSFDPHTGNLLRALPGLPPQQAAPEMFAAARLPSASPQDKDSAGAPIPSLSAPDSRKPSDAASSGAWEDEREAVRPRGGSKGGRSVISALGGPRVLRPVIVGIIVVASAAFLLLSTGDSGDAPESPSPSPSQPAPQAPERPVGSPPSDIPSSPTILLPLPQVLADAAGGTLPLSKEAVERLYQGVVASETDVFSSSPGSWVRVYALPLLGATPAGWRVVVSEWAVAPDGRDRLTLVLTSPSFPGELRWWAFVEPQDGLWLISELRPLEKQ